MENPDSQERHEVSKIYHHSAGHPSEWWKVELAI
jgi:hypothetical protein